MDFDPDLLPRMKEKAPDGIDKALLATLSSSFGNVLLKNRVHKSKNPDLSIAERCRSGRTGRSRKPLCACVPRVRIPVSPPPFKSKIEIYINY